MKPLVRFALTLLLCAPLAALAQQKAEGPIKPLPQVESGVNVEKRKREEQSRKEPAMEISKSKAASCDPQPVMSDAEIERCKKDRL